MAAQAVRDLKSAHDELTNYLREADFASDYATSPRRARPSLRSDAPRGGGAARDAWRPAVRGVSTQIEKGGSVAAATSVASATPAPTGAVSPRRAEAAADAAADFWGRHFGADAADAVAFDVFKGAAQAEVGALSSVDLQLLRLELMDERGRLSQGARAPARAPRYRRGRPPRGDGDRGGRRAEGDARGGEEPARGAGGGADAKVGGEEDAGAGPVASALRK